jgi:16S rRNA (uracil1498-N3)-methyltransferase
VFSLCKLKAAHGFLADFDAVLICWEEAPQTMSLHDALDQTLGDRVSPDMHIAVIVGPEGGLSASEVEFLLQANPNARLVTLGNTILRTETAGIVAPALVLYELGGLGAGERR